MTTVDRRFAFLRRLAFLCAAMVIAVTSLSAYIRLSKAGLGCADWPQCYGENLRRLQQGVAATPDEQTATAAARLAHRVAAVLALLLVVTMLAACFGSAPVLWKEGALALALLALALFLAVLGRWSSNARIPVVVIGNLLGGFFMLALCARLAAAGRQLHAPPHVQLHPPPLRVWAGVAVLLLVLQVALGGLLSASYSGLSCSAWADCLEAARGINFDTLNPWREPTLSAAPPFNTSGPLVQVLHRGMALALLLVCATVALAAWRHGRPRAGAALAILLIAQEAVGVAMVQGSLALPLAMLHNLLSAGLLATLVLLL